MNKHISIAAALLLSANIAICGQDTPNLKPKITEHKRTGLINASNIAISSKLFRIPSKTTECAIADDIILIDTTFTKYGLDWKAIASGLVFVASLAGYVKYDYNTHYVKQCIASFIVSALSARYLSKELESNVAENNGKILRMFYKQVDKSSLLIDKQEGKLCLTALSNLLSNPSRRDLNKSQEKIAQLAQEVIANHNEKIEDKDLYTSEVFAKLIEDFKAGC